MPVSPEIVDTATKLLIATVLAGLLGIERERKRRAAGLRTHIVVCIASTLAIIMSNELAREWAVVSTGAPLDRGRVIAGVLQGIGFIGAGAIINVASIHRGLTTAALIWFVAVLGIAIGLGYYAVAICSTAFVLAVVLLLEPFSEWLSTSTQFALSIRIPGGPDRVAELERFIESKGYRVNASRFTIYETEESVDMRFEIGAAKTGSAEKLIEVLNSAFDNIRQLSVER